MGGTLACKVPLHGSVILEGTMRHLIAQIDQLEVCMTGQHVVVTLCGGSMIRGRAL